MRHALIGLSTLVFLGCIESDAPLKTNFYQAPPTAMPAVSPASTDAAARVDTMGRRILAANPGIGGKPMFTTIGAPQPEVFHRGMTDIMVTEGLVRQCTDDQLAAVLSLELAKMVREREATAPPQIRTRDPLPPIDVRFGSDDRFGGTADRTDVHELVKFDADRKARRGPNKLPDPQVLGRSYLMNTGFQPEAMNEAESILKSAATESGLEKQLTAETRTQ